MAVDIKQYRQERAKGTPAKYAFAYASFLAKPTTYEWSDSAGSHFAIGRGKRDGFDIRIVVDYDEYGGYGSQPTETDENTGIRNPKYDREDRFYGRSKPFLALESGYTVPELAEDYRKQGMSKSVAWETARASLEEEAAQYMSEDYVQLVFRAEASLEGVMLGNAGGIASDIIIDYRTLESDLDGIVLDSDIVEQSIEEAREKLDALVVSKMEGLTNTL